MNSSVAATRYADAALGIYMSGNREDDIIMYVYGTFLCDGLAYISPRRLLDSRDPKTNHATLHLLNNLTRNSLPRL